ncbi:MAG: TlpA family protein disulfide reductase [Muribaculaceae bacterium]|nr:TlpA family protein disulfide reductase [Muribaculaceae bacterium]
MRGILTFLAIAMTVLGAQAAPQTNDSITCHITGIAGKHAGSTLAILIEAEKDFRIHPVIPVPVTDGRYSYTLRDDMPRVYQVIFEDELSRGGWKDRFFATGNGNVEIIGTDNDNDYYVDSIASDIPDNITANELSRIEKETTQTVLSKFHATLDSLDKCGKAYTPALQSLKEEYNAMEPCEKRDSLAMLMRSFFKGPKEQCYTAEYLECENKILDLYREMDASERAYLAANPSLYGLFIIKKAITYQSSWQDIPDYIRIFETVYKDAMPAHPYTQEIEDLIKARAVKAGNKYPDYKLTREDGTSEWILSLIKGNVAVIDLWASWCSPCRRHSVELIPLYEKYKDRGFKVVAVARESGNCDAMNEAMRKDGYPWESFVDLDDRGNVWRTNGANNSGGRIILVGADGVIVGTDLSTQEIADYLAKTYGE